jgi:hypothetical protein
MAYSCARMEESRGSSDVVGIPLTVTKTICSAQSHTPESHASPLSASFPPTRMKCCFWVHAITLGASSTSCWCKWNDKLGCYHVIYEHIMTLGPRSHSRNCGYCRQYWKHHVTRQRHAYSYTAQNMDPPAIYGLNQWGKHFSFIIHNIVTLIPLWTPISNL